MAGWLKGNGLFFGVVGGRRLLSLHGAPPFKITCHHHRMTACHHQEFFPPTFLFLGFSDCSVGKESAYNAEDSGLIPGSGRSTGEGIGYPLQYSWASLVVQLVKGSSCNAGDLGSIPGSGRSSEEGNGNPLQYSCLENPMNGGLQFMRSQRVEHD